MLKFKKYKKRDNILLLGAPNVGKSTFFNKVTSSVSQVANYSGTTNIATQGQLKNSDSDLVDLPGAHSLISSNQAEELTNKRFFQGNFNHAIGFLSALHFKRDLLSMVDYLESGVMPSLVVTQIDEQKRYHIAKRVLEKMLGINVMAVVTTKIKVNDDVLRKISDSGNKDFRINYDDKVEIAISSIVDKISNQTHLNKRFIAIQFLLGRGSCFKDVFPESTYLELENLKNNLQLNGRIDFSSLIFDSRKTYIDRIVQRVCKQTSKEVIKTFEKSSIDKILLNKFFGVVIFIVLMSLVYFLSFSEWTGGFLQAKITQLLIGDEEFLGFVGLLRQELIASPDQWFGVEMILQGILNPIFLVFSFLPYLFIFFFLTTLMKQSGYYSRVVAVFDSLLERFGLSGHSIVSLIAGLGCSIPAIISTRSISSKKERYITAFVAPLIPCSARLSINTILVALFFNSSFSWLIVIAITIGSGLVWLFTSLLLSKTIFRKEFQWIVLSIPKWRKPDAFSLVKGSWNMIREFIVKMGGYLVIAGLVIFFLSAITTKGINNFLIDGYNDSLLFHFSNNVGKIFIPAGFGNSWQTTAALLTGLPAKEVIITTLAATSGSVANISSVLTPSAAISFILFSTFYTPCTPTTALLKKEMKGKKWMTTTHLVGSFAFAWVIATIFYQLINL